MENESDNIKKISPECKENKKSAQPEILSQTYCRFINYEALREITGKRQISGGGYCDVTGFSLKKSVKK